MNPIISGYICTWNDIEFLSEVIDSIVNHLDSLNIIEGAFGSAILGGVNPRSNKETLDFIEKKRLQYPNKIKVFHINADTETQQRQKALEICRETGADFCWSIDSDEIFTDESVSNIKIEITKIFNDNSYYGIKLCSYNFFGNLHSFYHGEYPRIYRITPATTVLETNHVYWPDVGRNLDNYLILDRDDCKFFHLSYLRKNVDLFHIKMKFLQKEFGNDLYQNGYGETDGTYQIPIDTFFSYNGNYPEVIKAHPYFTQWTQSN